MQLPWLKHGKDVVSDSRFIVKYLFNTYPSIQQQEPADIEGAAKALLIQRLCEQHMYFTNLYHSVVPKKVRMQMSQSNMRYPLHSLPQMQLRGTAWLPEALYAADTRR